MDDLHRPPALSITEAEEFFGDGTDARSTSSGEQPETIQQLSDSVGIDLPGVGHVRPNVLASRSGREDDAVGEIPLPLRNQADGVSLLGELVAAATDLAEAQIEPATESEPAMCTECVKDAAEPAGIVHAHNCRVGRLQKLIAKVVTQPTTKEAATDGERPEAGDGIRPHGLTRVDAERRRIRDAFDKIAAVNTVTLCSLDEMEKIVNRALDGEFDREIFGTEGGAQ